MPSDDAQPRVINPIHSCHVSVLVSMSLCMARRQAEASHDAEDMWAGGSVLSLHCCTGAEHSGLATTTSQLTHSIIANTKAAFAAHQVTELLSWYFQNAGYCSGMSSLKS